MTTLHTTNNGSNHYITPVKDVSDRIHSAILFPLTFVQSHLFWLYSVIWALYTRWSSKDFYTNEQTHPEQKTKSETVESLCVTATRASRRSRGLSAPPPSQTSMIQREEQWQQRARGRTASTESSSSSSLYRRLLLSKNDALLRPLPQDERTGTTCPPQWWQKTLFFLDARKLHRSRSRSRSPSPPPLVLTTTFTPAPSLPLSRFSTDSVDEVPTMEAVISREQQGSHPSNTNTTVVASAVKRTGSRSKRFLSLLNHRHSSGKHPFRKKTTGPAPSF